MVKGHERSLLVPKEIGKTCKNQRNKLKTFKVFVCFYGILSKDFSQIITVKPFNGIANERLSSSFLRSKKSFNATIFQRLNRSQIMLNMNGINLKYDVNYMKLTNTIFTYKLLMDQRKRGGKLIRICSVILNTK